eukprot:scaffold6007_cov89-Skeletonema_dohrnii-CCMP3373.AAC.1
MPDHPRRIPYSSGFIALAYIKMYFPTDEEVKNLPCVVMTRDFPWDPSRYDKVKSDDVPVLPTPDAVPDPIHPGFNHTGEAIDVNYRESDVTSTEMLDQDWTIENGNAGTTSGRVPHTGELLPEPSDLVHCAYDLGYNPTYTELYSHYSLIGDLNVDYATQQEDKMNFVKYRKYFLNVPASTVAHTFDSTTRYYRFIPSTNLFMTYRSPYPALNVFCRHEIVFTDTVFANVPAWGGVHAAQVFAGKMSQYISVHGCKTDKDFPRCLEDEIRKRGAMDKLASDRAKAETSAKVLNWSDAPPEAWYAAFEYVTFIMNRTAKERLNWRTPVEALNGQTPDISMLLHFTFWEPVFIANYRDKGKKNFPSTSDEIIVRFVGFAEDVGHSCTFKVYNEETQEILYRSSLRKINPDTDVLNIPPYDPKPKDDVDDEGIEEIVQTRDNENGLRKTAMFEPHELVGRSFLMPHNPDGTRERATVIGYEQEESPAIDVMENFQKELDKQSQRVKFKAKVGVEGLERYVEWSDMCEFVEEQIQHDDQKPVN